MVIQKLALIYVKIIISIDLQVFDKNTISPSHIYIYIHLHRRLYAKKYYQDCVYLDWEKKKEEKIMIFFYVPHLFGLYVRI